MTTDMHAETMISREEQEQNAGAHEGQNTFTIQGLKDLRLPTSVQCRGKEVLGFGLLFMCLCVCVSVCLCVCVCVYVSVCVSVSVSVSVSVRLCLWLSLCVHKRGPL